MKEIRLALIGFGNVAQGLTQIIKEQGKSLEQKYGLRLLICAVTDPLKGFAFQPEGLDPASLLDAIHLKGTLKGLHNSHLGWDAVEVIRYSPADVVVEMSYTNLQTGEPATSYIAEALRKNKHVVTTNKGPIALNYDFLSKLAQQNEVQIGIEGTVMSGTPAIRLGRELLSSAGIKKIQGILNGTTNFILSEMESGMAYEEALSLAKERGYAEADPSGDVDGWDAAAKIAILGRCVLEKTINLEDIQRIGITKISNEDMVKAQESGMHWKLVGTIDNTQEKIIASVKPTCLPAEHPLARVRGVTNAIVFTTNLLGDVTLIGPGAGRLQTGYAVIQDLIKLFR